MLKKPIINAKFQSDSSGFTLIELLVVISIMGLLAGSILANYAGQRPARSLHIAQNEMVTNIRKTQSYALSSRVLPSGSSAEFYVLKFDTANSATYTIQGIYNVKNPPPGGTGSLQNVEAPLLPQGIVIKSLALNSGGSTTTPSCALVAFKLPFAKIITANSCNGGPPTVVSGDSYDSIVQFVSSAGGTAVADAILTITLSNTAGTLTNQVVINGITGTVTFQ